MGDSLNATEKVYLQLISLEPDPQQFKPYKPMLAGLNVFVEYELPAAMVLKGGMKASQLPKGAVIITPKGVARLAQLQNLAIRSVLENGSTA